MLGGGGFLVSSSLTSPSPIEILIIPENWRQTVVNVGIDIKDIPKIDDKDFSVTLNAFFVVQWTDERLLIDQEQVTKLNHLKHDQEQNVRAVF